MEENERRYLREVEACCGLSREEEVRFAIGVEEHLQEALDIISHHRQDILVVKPSWRRKILCGINPEQKLLSFESLRNTSDRSIIWPFMASFCRTLNQLPTLHYLRNKLRVPMNKAGHCRNQLIKGNLNLVISEVKKIENFGDNFLDLVQGGNIGLIASLDKFDWRQGMRLMSYAKWGITRAINYSMVRQPNLIYLPEKNIEILNSIKSVSLRAFQETGRKPSRKDLAVYLEIDEKKIDQLLDIANEPFDDATENEDLEWEDTIEDENAENQCNAVARVDLIQSTQDVLEQLNDRELKVIRMRFGIGMHTGYSLGETGKQFGVGRARIGQIEAKALRKLRHQLSLANNKLQSFVQCNELTCLAIEDIESELDKSNLQFLYRVERKLFADSQQREMTDRNRSKLEGLRKTSIKHCELATKLLIMDWVLNHRDGIIPYSTKITQATYTSAFRIILAQYVASGNAIPADIALQWILLHPDNNIKHADYCATKEFKKLFVNRYRVMFGSGLVVKAGKLMLTIKYKPANTLLSKNINCDIQGLTDTFALNAPLKKLNNLVNECIHELEPWFRFVRYKHDSVWINRVLIPAEIMRLTSDLEQIKRNLSGICANGMQLITIDKLYGLLGEDTPTLIGKIRLERLSIQLEKLSFGIVPDSHFYNIDLRTFSEVVVFPLSNGERVAQSHTYQQMERIIQLGVIACKMGIDPDQESLLRQKICDNSEFTDVEKESLNAFLYWCLHTSQETKRLNKNILRLSAAERGAVCRELVSAVHKKGRINHKSIKQLECLYTMLKLNPKQMLADIHALSVIDEPITIAVRDSKPTFLIPRPDANEPPSNTLILNKELIKRREEETRQVKSVLENVFVDQAEESKTTNPNELGSTGKHVENLLDKLDQTHRSLFRALLAQEMWEYDDFRAKCRSLGLMMDGAMEVINEWAFDYADAPLIEDGDPIYINVDVAMEMMNVK